MKKKKFIVNIKSLSSREGKLDVRAETSKEAKKKVQEMIKKGKVSKLQGSLTDAPVEYYFTVCSVEPKEERLTITGDIETEQ